MKVRVKNRYLDIELETIKEPGEEFNTAPERAAFLARKGHVEIIDAPAPAVEPDTFMNGPTPAADPEEEKPKPAPKKTTRKKKTE